MSGGARTRYICVCVYVRIVKYTSYTSTVRINTPTERFDICALRSQVRGSRGEGGEGEIADLETIIH